MFQIVFPGAEVDPFGLQVHETDEVELRRLLQKFSEDVYPAIDVFLALIEQENGPDGVVLQNGLIFLQIQLVKAVHEAGSDPQGLLYFTADLPVEKRVFHDGKQAGEGEKRESAEKYHRNEQTQG